MFSLRKLFSLFKGLKTPATQNNNRLILYNAALKVIGLDASPNDEAPDEYGCAETVNSIHAMAFHIPIGGDVSTYRMYRALLNHKLFNKVDKPLEGDIVISPTGYGNGVVSNGHVGIVSEAGRIMSNSSSSGRWGESYTLNSWKKRYVDRGGYPMVYFRRV